MTHQFKVVLEGYRSQWLAYACIECDALLERIDRSDYFTHPTHVYTPFLGFIPKLKPCKCSLAGKQFRLKPLTVDGIEL